MMHGLRFFSPPPPSGAICKGPSPGLTPSLCPGLMNSALPHPHPMWQYDDDDADDDDAADSDDDLKVQPVQDHGSVCHIPNQL